MQRKQSLSLNGQIIDYFLVIKNQKYIRLKIEGEKIIVSAPVFAQQWEIEHLIYKNSKKILKILEYNKKNKLIDFQTNQIKIFNEFKEFKLTDQNVKPNIKEFIFKEYETIEETVKRMYKSLSIMYYEIFGLRIENWKEKMDLDFKNFSLKEMKGKWGVCYPEKSKIILNIKLIHFPLEALDYLIVHEMSHLVHKNHSKDFWYHIQKYLPDYKKYSELLKVNG